MLGKLCTQLLGLILYLGIWLFTKGLIVALWLIQRPVYLAGGILLSIAANYLQSIDPIAAFVIGVGVAIALTKWLSHHDLIYRQLAFGAIGIGAGGLLYWHWHSGLLFPLLLSGLCVWQAQYPPQPGQY